MDCFTHQAYRKDRRLLKYWILIFIYAFEANRTLSDSNKEQFYASIEKTNMPSLC